MSKKDYPETVTKNNIQQLIEKAEKIKKKDTHRYSIVSTFIVVLAYLGGLGVFFLMFWLFQNNYLEFFLVTFPSELRFQTFFALLFIVMAVFWVPIMVFIVLFVFWLTRKYFGYPKHEEIIFAECFIIANHLINSRRLEAKKEVDDFLDALKVFVRDYRFNPKRKTYKPEFDLLRCGKNEICRMLMFSANRIPEIPNLLMNFGLAFVREDEPEAFSYLKQIVGRVQEYGEPKGRFRRFLGAIERYPYSSALFLTLLLLAVAILYFLITGEKIPMPMP